MEKENQMIADSGWLAGLLWRYKWTIIIATLAGGLIAYTATLFLPVQYEATAVVYAAGYDQNNQMVMKEGNALLLMAFLESTYLQESVIKKYNLAGHYGIDTASREGKTALENAYAGNINFTRTINKSIEISVKDEDPEFAAGLANGIVKLSNETKQQIIKSSTISSLNRIHEEYLEKQKEVDSLAISIETLRKQTRQKELERLREELSEREARISEIRAELKQIREEFQVHDLNQYIDRIQALYTQARSAHQKQKAKLNTYQNNLPSDDSLLLRIQATTAGLKQELEHLKSKLDSVSRYGNNYNDLTNELALQISLRDNLAWRISDITSTLEPEVKSAEIRETRDKYAAELSRLNDMKKKYEEAKATYEQAVPAAYLISKAKAEYTPDYPKTWLITLAGMFLMFVFTLGVLLVMNQMRISNK